VRLTQLIYLDAVIRHGSFHKAAAALHITQPTLSEQIHALEEELDVLLLQRSPTGTIPTAQGQQVHTHVQSILAAVDDIYQETRLDRHMEVRVGIIPTVQQWGCLGELATRMAGIQPHVQLQVNQYGALDITHKIDVGALDVGCVTWTDALAPRFPHTRVRKLVPGRIVLAVSPQHPLAEKSRVTLREIAAHPLVVFPEGYLMHELVLGHFRREGYPFRVLYYSENGATLIQTIRRGDAVGFLYVLDPSFSWANPRDDLVRIPVPELAEPIWLVVAHHAVLRGTRGRLIRETTAVIENLLRGNDAPDAPVGDR
jgi:DNA-binding transcriptional LysR family regulator